MTTITNVTRACVIGCTLRGRDVEIIYGDDHRKGATIVDQNTREVLRWHLTPQESRDLDDVVAERYQLKGTT